MFESVGEWDVSCDMCPVRYPHLHIRPMEEVLDYYSCDANAYGGSFGRDCLEGKLEDDQQIQSLTTLIERDGFRQGYGIGIREAGYEDFWGQEYSRPYIRDGHHRMTVLYFMGARWCPVQRAATHGQDTDDYRNEKVRFIKEREKA